MAQLLPLAIARFKTAGLRDLGQSAPYFHTGGAAELEDGRDALRDDVGGGTRVVVRNGDPELSRVAITADDVTALTAFLRALERRLRLSFASPLIRVIPETPGKPEEFSKHQRN